MRKYLFFIAKFAAMEMIHEHKYFLTADECDAQRHMSARMLVERIIETATEHANILHIGYADLAPLNIGWVLSRLSFEVDHWPGINSEYTLRTWITDCERFRSTRSHELLDSRGRVVGRVRTVWAAIDTARRTAADLSVLDPAAFVCPERECPLLPMRPIRPLGVCDEGFDYVFRVSDLDVNRHVTTARHVELCLDACPLEWYDEHDLHGLDMAFQHEGLFGSQIRVQWRRDDSLTEVELMHDGQRLSAARLRF